MFQSGSSLGFSNSLQGEWIQQAIAQVIANPMFGTTVEHFQAQLVEPENYTKYGQPDYLAANPGDYAAGIQYIPNPANPLRGIFCRAKYNPYQDKGGIYLQAQAELYLPHDPGEVFVLDGKYPKRQDRFVISGGVYYAVAPTFPCQLGDTVAAFKIELSRERFPVRTDNAPAN